MANIFVFTSHPWVSDSTLLFIHHKYSIENGLHQIRRCDQRNDSRARPIRDQRISDVSDRLESLTTESTVPLRGEDVSLVSKYFADCSLIVQIVDVV